MKLPVVLSRIAQREYDHAADWYEQERRGLGTRFTRAVRALLDEIAADPLRYAKEFEDIREAKLKKYRYCVYYRIETSRIVVIAVFHTSRDPQEWQSRA